MSPSYTVTSRTGYGSRLGNSVKAIGTGFLLLIGSIILLGWNENNFVEQKAALEETEGQTIEVSADKIDAANDKSAVYVNGKTSSPDENPLVDEVFGIKTDDLKLIRNVEMYQWKEEEHTETEDNLGGSQTTRTTYTYDKVWSDEHIDSSRFYKPEYSNPDWEYDGEEYVKDPILLGAFTLSSDFVKKLTDKVAVSLSGQNITPISGMKIMDSLLYIGNDPKTPEIGDLKITFFRVPAGAASAVGQQYGENLKPFMTSNKRSISLLEQDNIPVNELFAHAHSANLTMTWILRIIGFFLLWAAFSMIFGIFESLAKVVPFIGDIVGAATGIVTFCLALIVWIVTIAIAWLAVRPIYGVIAIIAVVGIIAGMIYMKKNNPRQELSSPEDKKDSHKEEPKQDSSEPEIIEA